MKQTDVDLLLAKAQIALAFLFSICVFALVFVLIFYHQGINSTALTVITTVISALVTILTLIANFFFARTRPPALPDPTPVSGSPPAAPSLTMTTTVGATNAPAAQPISAATLAVSHSPEPARPAGTGIS